MNRLSSVTDLNSAIRPDITCSTRPASPALVAPDGGSSRRCTTKARWGSSRVGDSNRIAAWGRQARERGGRRVMRYGYRHRAAEVFTSV